MKSNFGHVQVNIDPQDLNFYRDLFAFLDWSVLYEDENMLGVGDENGASVWFTAPIKPQEKNDYDGLGMNHLAIAVEKQSNVDDVYKFLKEHAVPALFGTPRHRPEFCGSPSETYYQVMFESPNRILFEVVYTGPKH
jgi:catechol 2,3-dioxygenase-like lactoylglutathione lyase family enzyme